MNLKYLLVIWLILLSSIFGLLIYEYLLLVEQNTELVNIKNEYDNLISEVKDMISKKKTEKHKLALKLEKEIVAKLQPKKITPVVVSSSNNKSNSNKISGKKYLKHDIYAKLLKEPIFIWPLEKSQFWISSRYGPRKKADGSAGFHLGLDLAASRGTLIKAAGSGMVVESGFVSGYGNTIVISHNNKFKTRYAHLDKIFVKVGQKVSQKEYIGQVGSTGSVRTKSKRGDPSHLHFEVYLYNKQVNPLYFLY